MSASAADSRSDELEKIRVELRKHLDKCARMEDRRSFKVTQDTLLDLSPSEQTAMRRQIEASHEDKFVVTMIFQNTRRRRKSSPHTTTIVIEARRKGRLDGRLGRHQ